MPKAGGGTGSDTISRISFTQSVDQQFLVEPLQGPVSVLDQLDRFPDTVYNKSPESHLVKLLYTLLGPTGVGLIEQRWLTARLITEASNVKTRDLESFYADPFSFGRILAELPNVDPSGPLTDQLWEILASQDAMYRSRAIDFLHGVRLGNTPEGMRLVARSGIGRNVQIVENYKFLFDQHSDRPVGLPYLGQTTSTEEMVILPDYEVSKTQAQTVTSTWTPVGPSNMSAVLGGGGSLSGTYKWKVGAVLPSGETLPSATVSLTATGQSANLSWNPVTGATNYHVYRASGGGSFGLVTTTSQTSYVDTGAATSTSLAEPAFQIAFNGYTAPSSSTYFTFDPQYVVQATATTNVNISNPGTNTFGGVTVSAGNYVRLPYQTTASQNGIYLFNGSSSAMTATSYIFADAYAVQGYLQALPSVAGRNVQVTGGASDTVGEADTLGTSLTVAPYQIIFSNSLAARNLPLVNIVLPTNTTLTASGFSVTSAIGGVDASSETVSIAPADLHALQVAVDRIKPETTIPTINLSQGTRQSRPWNNIYSTSTQTQVTRFVTGRTDITWPATDEFHWVVGGQEVQAPRMQDDIRHDYLNLHNVSAITSSSSHVGAFNPVQCANYSFLSDESGIQSEQVSAYQAKKQANPSYTSAPPTPKIYTPDHALPAVPGSSRDLYVTQVGLPDDGSPVGLITGIYPYDYTNLAGVKTLTPGSFWASAEASSGAETLIIDLGTPQAVNYLDMEISRKPFNISIAYDLLDQAGTTLYQPVVPSPYYPYPDVIVATSDPTNPWEYVVYNFTNGVDDVIFTRWIQITFARGIAPSSFSTLGWSIEVRNLRIGRVAGS